MATARPASALIEEITAGELRPLYLLLGDDEAEKVHLVEQVAATIDEDLRAFNLHRFYGADVSPGAVVDVARTLPMGSPRRVVVVWQAEKLIEPKRSGDAAARALVPFEHYVKSPEPLTALLLVAGALDKRRKLATLLMKQASVIDCPGVGGARDPARWLRGRFEAAGLAASPRAIQLLLSHAGLDTARLRADVQRLKLYVAAREPGAGNLRKVEVADVLEFVGPMTSQDDWAVTGAIEQRDVATALREVGLSLEAGAVPQMVLGQLAWFVRTRLPSERVPPAVEAVFRTDLALKSSGGDARVLLERLIVELCGEGSRTPRRPPGARVEGSR